MISYQAARSYFSVLAFLSWCVIIIGGLVALVAFGAVGQMSRGYGGSSMAGLAGMVPGLGIMFAGFMGLVLVQIGRAGVDTAEYTQQMLQISRDQLEVSKEALKQGVKGEAGYAALEKAKKALTADPATAAGFASVTGKPAPEVPEEPYEGRWQIEEKYGRYYAKGKVFNSEKEAIAFLRQVDRVEPVLSAERPKAQWPGQTRFQKEQG